MEDLIISVSITQAPARGENVWAYAVNIGDKFHKIGYGLSYEQVAKLAKSGVKSARKYVASLSKNEIDILKARV